MQMEDIVLYPGASSTARSSLERVMDRRKRRSSEGDALDAKRPRISVYFRLESESSIDSDDDTESVYSIQEKETDVARDTSDTDSNGGSSSIALELEYEVASLSSDNDNQFPDYSSSGTEDLNLQAAEGAIAAVLMDTSVDAWATDGETESESSSDTNNIDVMVIRRDFWTCVLCKSRKDNKFYRYCNKCFQVRKTFFPPRPKGTRKRKRINDEDATKKVKLDTLKSCLSQIKKQGGAGPPSAETAAGPSTPNVVPHLNFEGIVIPREHLKATTALTDSVDSDSDIFNDEGPTQRKRPKLDDNLVEAAQQEEDSTRIECKSNNDEEILLSQKPSEEEIVCKNSINNSLKSKLSLDLDTTKAHVSSDQSTPTTDDGLESKFNEAECGSTSSSSACLNSDSGISCKTFESSQELGGTCESKDNNNSSSHTKSDDLCIICNNSPKNGIFLHGQIGHMCCCYKCAMRIWKNCKRCPLCNCKVKNVVKLFTM